ncbi:hypothetical protein K488DRAFT_90915 [Vararia minispora EC-137]|uniref:Uncharacterized protein n=1 Tax=Vararia minispora EC-137 TaxID=1314806 RepID=A0ACB8Q6F1_9AGAM|nr:hypothetical protein K488DRAFT_90915 [Vararia minispora EC-137]
MAPFLPTTLGIVSSTLTSTPTPPPTPSALIDPSAFRPVLPLLLVGCVTLALITALHVVLFCTNRAIRADVDETRREAMRARVGWPKLFEEAEESGVGAGAQTRRSEVPRSAPAAARPLALLHPHPPTARSTNDSRGVPGNLLALTTGGAPASKTAPRSMDFTCVGGALSPGAGGVPSPGRRGVGYERIRETEDSRRRGGNTGGDDAWLTSTYDGPDRRPPRLVVPPPSLRTTERIRRVLFRDAPSFVGTDDVEAAVEAPSTAGLSPAPSSPGTAVLPYRRTPKLRPASLRSLIQSNTPSSELPSPLSSEPATPRSASSETIERIVAVYSSSGHSEDDHRPFIRSSAGLAHGLGVAPAVKAAPRSANASVGEPMRTALWFPRPPLAPGARASAFAPVDARVLSPSPRLPGWGSDAPSVGQASRPSSVMDSLDADDVPVLLPQVPARARMSARTAIAEQFMRALVLDGQSGQRSAIRTISHSSFPLSDETGFAVG